MDNVLENLILKRPQYPDVVKKELAAVTGLSVETINRYCRKKDSAIDARVAIIIADYFKCSVNDLYVAKNTLSERGGRKFKSVKEKHQK